MTKLHIQFYEKRKIFFIISIAIILLGIVFNVIFGTQLDIQFTGGAVVKYSYTGEVNTADIENLVKEATNEATVKATVNNSMDAENPDEKQITLQFGGTDALTLDQQKAIIASLNEKYPDQKFELASSSSVNPSMGRTFFVKCLVAIGIAAVLLIIYVSIRFKKIGGFSAGVMAIVALLHDIAVVYFVFVAFRIPLNDSFIAVVLTILGYSVNDTIVIYDRIRENRRLLGSKESLPYIMNLSLNQVFSRSVFTSLTTFAAVTTVYVVGLIYNLPSITSFAFPMMFGIVVGCYSSLCIAAPLYVMWEQKKLSK